MALTKKKKKNMITLLSLCVVLILLTAAYFAVSKWKERPEKEEEDTGLTIVSIQAGQIKNIGIRTDSYGYTLAVNENAWVMSGDEEFPIDTAKVEAMTDVLAEFKAEKLVLASAQDLSEYGLETPALTVTVQKKDGGEIAVAVGDRSGADGGYYACMSGMTDVYLIAEETREYFALTKDDLMLLDTVPEFDAEKAEGLKVTSDTYRSFTIKDSTGDVKDLTAMALYTLGLYDVYETPVRVDLTSFASLMENYVSVSLGDFVSYHAADAPAHGLASPKTALTVWYAQSEEDTELQEFTIYFGAYTEDKSKVYVRLEGSNQIFAMDAADADALLSADTFSVISKYTQMVNITTISGLDIAYGEEKRDIVIAHETTTEDSGNTVTKDTFTVDGKTLKEGDEAEEFRDLYQALIALKISGELPEDAVMNGKTVLSIDFMEKDTGEFFHRVRYLVLEDDDAHYAVEENGTCLFLADAAAVDEMIVKLKEYQP